MTAFRLVDSENVRVREILQDMETISPLGKAILNRTQVLMVESEYELEMTCLID